MYFTVQFMLTFFVDSYLDLLFHVTFQTGYYFEESLAIATSLQEDLLSRPNLKDEVVMDDRFKLSIGKRIKQCYQAGFPHIIVVGKKVRQDIKRAGFALKSCISGSVPCFDFEVKDYKLKNMSIYFDTRV